MMLNVETNGVQKVFGKDCSTSRLPGESFAEVTENANGPDQDLASVME